MNWIRYTGPGHSDAPDPPAPYGMYLPFAFNPERLLLAREKEMREARAAKEELDEGLVVVGGLKPPYGDWCARKVACSLSGRCERQHTDHMPNCGN